MGGDIALWGKPKENYFQNYGPEQQILYRQLIPCDNFHNENPSKCGILVKQIEIDSSVWGQI